MEEASLDVYAAWVRGARPRASIERQVRQFVASLFEYPRGHPAAEAVRRHPYVTDDLRWAVVPGTDVGVVYAVDEDGRSIRLLSIGPRSGGG